MTERNKHTGLAELVTESGAARLEAELAEFGENAPITDGEQQRILSSVMRKAGLEMKDNITVKRTRRHSRRFVGFVVAAAVIGAGAIGSSAYYMANRGTWNAVKYKFEGSDSVLTDEQINEAAETIERITAPGGVCEVNTFEELDITYEGTVADQDMQMLFTIRRKDGQPFEEKENYVWMYKYTEGLYAYEDDDTLYPVYHDLSAINFNDDGSLSATVDGYVFYRAGFDEYDYRLGFVDLCYVPYGVQKMSSGDGAAFELGSDAFMAGLRLLGDPDDSGVPFGVMAFPNKLEGEEYDAAFADWQAKDSAYENALRDSAEYYFSGEMLYRIPSASLKNSVPVFTKEQTGSEFEVTVSPQRITLKADGNFDEAVGRYSDHSNPDRFDLSIDVHKLDGSTETLSVSEGKGGSYALSDGTPQEYFTFEFIPDVPIKAEDIEYIQLSDVRINING